MLNYKGIFYKEEKEKKFYEGGAHFKYSDLVFALKDLIKQKNKNDDTEIIKNIRDDLISSFNRNIHIEEKESSKISKEKKINSNLLTINTNYKIQNKIKLINTRRHILNTDKNIEKEKARKKRLIELLSYNLKIYPFNKNYSNSKKKFSNNSTDKNYNRNNIKTLGYNDNYDDSNNYMSLHIINKKIDNNNLPLIQSSYFNNLSNNIMVGKRNDNNNKTGNLDNLRHISKFTLNKTKISKDNLFLNNKILSPIKNFKNNRKNVFSNDFSESNKNSKNYDTINILTKKTRNFIPGKLSKYLNNKLKKSMNINMIHYTMNKNE